MSFRALIAVFFTAIKFYRRFDLVAREEWDKIASFDPDESADSLTPEMEQRLETLATQFAAEDANA